MKIKTPVFYTKTKDIQNKITFYSFLKIPEEYTNIYNVKVLSFTGTHIYLSDGVYYISHINKNNKHQTIMCDENISRIKKIEGSDKLIPKLPRNSIVIYSLAIPLIKQIFYVKYHIKKRIRITVSSIGFDPKTNKVNTSVNFIYKLIGKLITKILYKIHRKRLKKIK